MALRGLHHITAICRDLDRTTAFYRDLLGLALVRRQRSDDDPDARSIALGIFGLAGELAELSTPELTRRVGNRWIPVAAE